MPAALDVNWEAVRVLAIAIGVREAARRMNVPEQAALKRSQREGWLDTPEAQASVKLAHQARGLVSTVSSQPSAAQAMAMELVSLNAKSRIGVARGLAKAATHIEQMTGPDIVADASNVKQTVQSLGIVHGWQANQAVAKVSLSITGAHQVSVETTADAVDAEWSDEQVVDGESVE